MSRNLVIMGVSGCGKSTVGKIVADEIGLTFFDGDSFHTQDSKEKMKAGVPLTDLDRQVWLRKLNTILIAHKRTGCVLACSALKESYRKLLSINNDCLFIYLKTDKKIIQERFKSRKGHFMPASLIDSQFSTLEEPGSEAISVEANQSIAAIISEIMHRLGYEY